MSKVNAPGLAGRESDTERARRLAGLPVEVYRLPRRRWWQFWKARP